MKRHIFTILTLLSIAFSAVANPVIQQADSAYSAGRFKEAISLYRQAIAADGASAPIWYNLGNAYYRADSLSSAIICYERALKWDPTFSDARENLDFVNSRITDTVPDTSSYSTLFVEKASRLMSSDGWAILSVVIFVAVLCLVAVYIFSSRVGLRKVCFFSAIGMLLLTGASISLSVMTASLMKSGGEAIVTAPSTRLSTSPSTPLDASQQAYLLHEGSKVEILDSVATPHDPNAAMWYEVTYGSAPRAWINAADVEKI